MEPSKNLIIDGVIAEDIWTYIEDDSALVDGPCVVSLARLKQDFEALQAHPFPLGLVVRAGTKQGEDINDVANMLDALSLIAIDFPVYRNGRGFSTARVLREDYDFKGELRAVGEVLFDQLVFMQRCGFNAYALPENMSPDTYNQAMRMLPGAYQPASDQRRGIIWQRHNQKS